MDKVTLNGLSIFLTHRCNMACPHCLRGAAEDTDISPDTIDALLEQTEMIDTLSLTGGEPLLAVETIKYIAYGLAKRGIMLFRLQIVTNGFEYNEQFVEAIKMFRQIIDISRREGCEDDTYDPIDEKWRILIGVSLDRYHENPDVCRANYERYRETLEGVADVLKIRHGNAPSKMGRAEALPEAVDQTHTFQFLTKQRIEVLDANHTPVCGRYEQFGLVRPEQKVICCTLLLDVDGSIKNDVCGDFSFQRLRDFPTICKVTDPLWESVLAYGKGRISCVESRYQRLEYGLNNDHYTAEALRMIQLNSDPDALDEASSFDDSQKMRAAQEAILAGCKTVDEIQAYITRRAMKQTIDDHERSCESIAQESREYHHGSGILPAYRKPERSLIARCQQCGKVIWDMEPIGSTPTGHTRKGTYYKCHACGGSTLVEPNGHTIIDKSVRCGWCGKVVINNDGRYIHCSEDFYTPGRIVCHYCKHPI